MGLFQRLFGTKKQSVNSDRSGSKTQKRRWSFVKSSKDKSQLTTPYSSRFNGLDNPSSLSGVIGGTLDANNHAIAVAAATAAVAEAALAAAHAAAEVVRLTSGAGTRVPRCAYTAHFSNSQRVLVEDIAAVKIQSAFRGYLARRALRALKALVKLQALVRGHIVRKKTADMLRRMQTLVKLQSQARASRISTAETLHSSKSSLSNFPIPVRNDDWEHPYNTYDNKFERSSVLKRCSSNSNFREIDAARTQLDTRWLDHWMEEHLWTQRGDTSLKTEDDKILEVDTWKPHLNSVPSNDSFNSSQPQASHYICAAYDSPSKPSRKPIIASLFSMKASSLSYLNFPIPKDEAVSRTAENSPAFSSSSRTGSGARRSPFTPTRSEYSWGFFNGYSGHPNYMANTESSRAKARSLSAPRQRFEFERSGSTSKSIQGSLDAGVSLDMDADFRTKASQTSIHFNRLGSTDMR